MEIELYQEVATPLGQVAPAWKEEGEEGVSGVELVSKVPVDRSWTTAKKLTGALAVLLFVSISIDKLLKKMFVLKILMK